jgi:hypothetical protein
VLKVKADGQEEVTVVGSKGIGDAKTVKIGDMTTIFLRK